MRWTVSDTGVSSILEVVGALGVALALLFVWVCLILTVVKWMHWLFGKGV